MNLPDDFRELLEEFARSKVEATQDLVDVELLERVRAKRSHPM
jgi:hypothetical protein